MSKFLQLSVESNRHLSPSRCDLLLDLACQPSSVHPWDRFLAGRINLGDPNLIRSGEDAREVMCEVAGPAEEMGLEDGDKS
jgi:hypothetical protein